MPGETMALVGHTGSGKTSIISLINRLYHIHKGNIEIDDVDIDDAEVSKLLHEIKELLKHDPKKLNDKYFIYHADKNISTLAVSLLNYPYEESPKWLKEMGDDHGFQKNIFEKDFKSFSKTIAPGNEEKLNQYKLISKDRTPEKIISAINYLKLKKIKRMILESQKNIEEFNANYQQSIFVQNTLKEMERNITNELGSVIVQ
jgi:DNA primase